MSRIFNSRYEIEAMIGTGGMADVYQANDLRLNRKVAVKILRSDLARDPAFISRFKKEALAAGALSNPGIVAVYDSGIDGNDSYIVMELVSGHTLREVLQNDEKLTQAQILEIIAQVLEALEYSHHMGIVHRDIKPGNIMMTNSGRIKVMDFGIARALDDIGATMTNTWNVVGTAQYLSPEQATGESADHRSDIYSVGALMYELLVGRPPFIGDTPVSIAFQHVSSPLISPTEFAPDLDPNLVKIMEVALCKDPSDRYQDAGAMLDDLHRAMRGESVTTKLRKVHPQRRFAVVAVGILVFALAISSAFLIKGKTAQSTSIELPNVVGLTQQQAQTLLSQYTINIQHAPDSRIPKGRVSSELPLPATKVLSGSSVTLTISDGPGNTTVPTNLIGLSLADARTALTSAGLLISQALTTDSNQQPGTVLAVSPAPGSILSAGSSVVLNIASGNLQVPALVGISNIEAITQLTQAGFLVKTAQAWDPTQNPGVVLAQAPDAGTTQSIGSPVTITINTNPDTPAN